MPGQAEHQHKKLCQKLHVMEKIALICKLVKSCAEILLPKIALFWWD